MSTLKKYFTGFGLLIVGMFGGLVILGLSNAAGNLIIGPSSDHVTADTLRNARFAFFAVYQILVGIPMLYMAMKKGLACIEFHFSLFTITPLAIFFLKDIFAYQIRLPLLYALASLAIYHIAVICSRYYREKKRAAGLITRR